MILTKEQLEEFEEATKPLMKFLCDNFHPHVIIIVERNRAEILESSASIICSDFIKD